MATGNAGILWHGLVWECPQAVTTPPILAVVTSRGAPFC